MVALQRKMIQKRNTLQFFISSVSGNFNISFNDVRLINNMSKWKKGNITLSEIMLKNGHTYFENLAVTPQGF